MKKIISGKLYDTDTAEIILRKERKNHDEHPLICIETLFILFVLVYVNWDDSEEGLSIIILKYFDYILFF